MEQCTPYAYGLDIGDRKCDICALDPAGEVIERTQVPTTQVALRRYFSRVEPGRVAMEVGTHSSWVEDAVSGLKHEVYVANARKLRAIWDNDKKNDRTDAQMLAEVVQLKPSLLRPIKHRGEEARADLRLVHTRSTLVRARTMMVNHVRGTVKSAGSRMPTCSTEAFHKATGELPAELKHPLEPLMKQVGETTALIRGYDKALKERAAEYPEVKVLTQVPGVGELTALAFVATIEDPNRFPQNRKVGSYLGLRPRLDESCTIHKQLRITKAGDKYLRQLLVGSAQYILGPFGPDTDLRRWGLKLAERGGKNAKKRAAVAVARKLGVLLLTLWKTGAAYDPLRLAKGKDKEVPALPATNAVSAVEQTKQVPSRKPGKLAAVHGRSQPAAVAKVRKAREEISKAKRTKQSASQV